MNCTNHEQNPAVAVCSRCGQALCQECSIHWKDAVVCKRCLEAHEGHAGDSKRAKNKNSMRKSPALAGILSILPGMGQVYVGYYVAGFIYLLIVAATITFLSRPTSGHSEPFFGLFLTFFWIFSIVDAVRKAQNYNRATFGEEIEKRPTDSPLVGGVILLLMGLILTLEITFNIELDFLEYLWPLAVLGGGIYMIVRYFRTREQLRQEQMTQASRYGSTATGGGAGSGPVQPQPPASYE